MAGPSTARAQIYAALDASSDVIEEYTITGSPVAVSPPLDSSVTSPQGIAYSGGELYVAEDSGSDSIGRFSATASNSGTNTFVSLTSAATSIAVSGGDLYVGTASGKVYEYTLGGALVGTGPLVTVASGDVNLAISGNTLFVGDNGGSGSIGAYNATTGAALGAFSAAAPGDGNVRGLAVIGSTLYLADPTSGKVFEYATTGTGQTAATSFTSSGAMSLSAFNGNLYVGNLTSSASALESLNEYSATGTSEGAVITGLPGETYGSFVAVPEPATGAAILGLSALGIAGWRRRFARA
jgi:hypothetical protein